MISAKILNCLLDQHTGTTRYHRLFGGLLGTDGVSAIMQHGLGWLVDVITSVQTLPRIKQEDFQFWKLTTDIEAHRGVVVCTDGNNRVLYRQKIPYTDMTIPEIVLYVEDDPQLGKVLMLSRER